MVFIPAVSVGLPVEEFWPNNEKLPNTNKSCRFYKKDENPVFKYPWLLVSVAHNHKQEDFIHTNLGFKDNEDAKKQGATIFGDSGGFQIVAGRIEYSDELREKYANWLNHNCTIAPNLDLPPYVSSTKELTTNDKFKENLKVTIQNHKWQKKQVDSGKLNNIKWLQVLHGNTSKQLDVWYKNICQYRFNGWAVGSAPVKSGFYILTGLFKLFENKEVVKDDVEYIHVFGASDYKSVLLISYWNYKVRQRYPEAKFVLTYDSSSPWISAAYGTFSYAITPKHHYRIEFSNKYEYNMYDEKTKFPCSCPVCKGMLLRDIVNFEKGKSRLFHLFVPLHNLYKFIEYNRLVTTLVKLDYDRFKTKAFGAKNISIFRAIDKTFEQKNPVEYFQQFFKLFMESHTVYSDGKLEKIFK